jgi:hypothetical protein
MKKINKLKEKTIIRLNNQINFLKEDIQYKLMEK